MLPPAVLRQIHQCWCREDVNSPDLHSVAVPSREPLLPVKNPSTSVPSDGEEQFMPKSLNLSQALSSSSTASFPSHSGSACDTSFQRGKGEGWTTEAIVAFSAKHLPQRGPEVWVYSGGILCMRPLC